MIFRPHRLFQLGLLVIGLLVAAVASFLLDMSASTFDPTVRFLPGPCSRAYDPHTLTITASDGIPLCVTGMETKPLGWALSQDGSRFAFALPTGRTPPPYLRPKGSFIPEAMWFVIDRNGGNKHRFGQSNNTWLSLSTDGQYARVPLPCALMDFGRCSFQIFEIDTERMICQYEVWNVFYSHGDSKCTSIPLRNGQVWDIRKESNDQACAYWVPQKQFVSTCAGLK